MASSPPYGSSSPPYGFRQPLPETSLPISNELRSSSGSTESGKLPSMGPGNGSLITPRRNDGGAGYLPEAEGSAASNANITSWLKIEDYATQIRIVALQARCGAAISPDQVQKAHELAAHMQEELQPLLAAVQGGNNGNYITPIPQLRPIGGGSPGVRSSMMMTNKLVSIGQGQAAGAFAGSPGYAAASMAPPLDGTNPMFTYTPPSDHSKPKPRQKRKRPDDGYRVCKQCLTSETPEWRRGPDGPRTLCNACGLKWAKKQRAMKREGILETDEDRQQQAQQHQQQQHQQHQDVQQQHVQQQQHHQQHAQQQGLASHKDQHPELFCDGVKDEK